MRQEHASSLPEFIELLDLISTEWYPSQHSVGAMWFRGQSRRSWTLLPTLYRPNVVSRGYDEVTLFEDFKALAPSGASPQPSTEWEWYYLARQHGLPSRLLDWTENALAAAWFAISGWIEDKGEFLKQLKPQPPLPPVFDDESPAVWVMDPGSLNRLSFGAEEERVFVVGGGFSSQWLPDAVSGSSARDFAFEGKDCTNAKPMAIFPVRRTSRIIAQQGVHTLHGHDQIPLESLRLRNEHHEGLLLAQIMFDRAKIASLFDQLQLIGVNRFSLFPDLDNLAKHLEWIYWG